MSLKKVYCVIDFTGNNTNLQQKQNLKWAQNFGWDAAAHPAPLRAHDCFDRLNTEWELLLLTSDSRKYEVSNKKI